MHSIENTMDPALPRHRALGIQLHRYPARGFHEGVDDDPDFRVTVFVVIGEITKSNFNLPYNKPSRWHFIMFRLFFSLETSGGGVVIDAVRDVIRAFTRHRHGPRREHPLKRVPIPAPLVR